jgi:uncharacterized cupin superfamily protein
MTGSRETAGATVCVGNPSGREFSVIEASPKQEEAGLKMKIPPKWIEAAASGDLEPAPISPDWILAGTPTARSKVLARSHDRTTSILVWECTAGCFNWSYNQDEIVMVIAGEVFISTENGEERRLGQGEMAFFPAGSSCTWRVREHIKKIAILRKDLPLLLGFAVLVWHKLLRMAGLRAQSPLTRAAV